DAWIPTGIARLRRWRATPARAWSTATSEDASARRLAAATCYTDAGEPCFEVTDLELVRRAAEPSAQQSAAGPWRAWIHTLAWRRLGPCVAPAVSIASLARAAEADPVDAELLARVARYAEGLAALEVLAGELASAQLRALGGLEPGAIVELEQLR